MTTASKESMVFLKKPTDDIPINIETMLIHNHKLMYSTRILLILLWSYPANKYFNYNELVKMSPEGITEVSEAIQESLNVGALEINEKASQWELISPKKWMV